MAPEESSISQRVSEGSTIACLARPRELRKAKSPPRATTPASLNDLVLEAQREAGSGLGAEMKAEELTETLVGDSRLPLDLIYAESRFV